jgi:hypothetical protein
MDELLDLLNRETSALLPVLRRLNLLKVPTARLATRWEARRFLEGRMAAQGLRERVEEEGALYATLGLAPEALDLYSLYVGMTLEQVSGYYDPANSNLLVVSRDGTVGAREVLYLAYAYSHALQQVTFDVAGLRERVREARDAGLALEALSQGDAVLTMSQYGAQRLRGANTGELLRPQASPALARAPFAIRELFLFPFTFGVDFVLELHRGGGWARVDSAYQRLPGSTTEVLHPAKYVEGFKPVPVQLPELAPALGPSWRLRSGGALGEFRLRLYLGSHLSGEEALAGAAGWSGDGYALLEDAKGSRLLASRSLWESVGEAREFFEAISRLNSLRRDWAESGRDDGLAWWRSHDEYASVWLEDREVVWVLAPADGVGRRAEAVVTGR